MGHLDKRFPQYSRFLKFYPATYQREYGQQMLQTLADMLDDEHSNQLFVWLRTSLDLPFSLVKQNIAYAGGIMKKETPGYIKRSTIAGAILLTPFFSFIVLDSLTSHSLYSTWFWKTWVVATWIIFMPAAAFLIALATFVKWSADEHNHKKRSFWQTVFDIHHNWPMVIIGVLSLGIIALALGHDSVHCVVNNPINDIKYWHTTLRCIQQG